MYQLYFEVETCILYVIVGILCVVYINGFMKTTDRIGLGHSNASILIFNNYTLLFFFTLLFLAVFRKVTNNLGGSDAPTYIENFLYISKGGIDRGNNSEMEWGFQELTRIIRSITDNYKIYFAFVYGIIIFGYIKFIKDCCPRWGVYIPFILLMYPFIKSFNTVRTSVAISFILMGACYLDKSKWKSLLFIASSVFIHRMSLLFVVVWPFYFIVKRYQLSRVKFIVVSITGVTITFFVSTLIQQYVVLYQLVDGTDAYYIQATMGQDYLMRYPMFIGQMVLFIMLVLNYNSIKWDGQMRLLRTLFIYDICMVPAGLVLGMWRSIEYFYLVRLSLWSALIFAITKKDPGKYGIILKIGFFFVFVAWLVFRIYKEYEDTKTSPYIFDLGF